MLFTLSLLSASFIKGLYYKISCPHVWDRQKEKHILPKCWDQRIWEKWKQDKILQGKKIWSAYKTFSCKSMRLWPLHGANSASFWEIPKHGLPKLLVYFLLAIWPHQLGYKKYKRYQTKVWIKSFYWYQIRSCGLNGLDITAKLRFSGNVQMFKNAK